MSRLYGSVPENNTSKWHPEPTFRGTFGILSSCLITMVLCIWTCIHLNIPEHNEPSFFGIRNATWRKVKWMLIGLFAPEYVAWVAFVQRRIASIIHKRVLERAESIGTRQEPADAQIRVWRLLVRIWHILCTMCRTEPVKFEGRHDWTMAHSHYVAMGGLALNLKALDIRFLHSEKYTQFTLTPFGFAYVVAHMFETIPDISAEDIWDKSKANGLAKILICVQASWFCIQCLHRLAQSLTISLLELNTFAHALCTLLIYVLWWNKPLNVDGRISLESSPTNAKKHAAYMLVHTMNSSSLEYKTQKGLSLYRSLVIRTYRPHSEEVQMPDKQRPDGTYRIPLHTVVDGFILDARTRRRIPIGPIGRRWDQFYKHADLDETEMTTLRLAFHVAKTLERPFLFGKYLDLRVGNRPNEESIKSAAVAFIISGLVYGSIHLTAWNAPFRNDIQKFLWRISSVTVAGAGVPITLIIWVSENLGASERPFFVVTAALFFIYIACRVFIVIECFIFMAHLPEAAYQVPRWSQYFPHIG